MDDNTKELIKYGVIGFASLYILKQIGVSFGLIKSEEEKAQDQLSDQSILNSINQALSTQTPTKTEGEWSQIASIIYEDLKYSSLDDNKADAVYQLARAKNDADVWSLIKFFGKRQEYAFGIPLGDKKNLPQFVSTNITPNNIALLNDNYRRKNIKYRF